MAQCNYDEERAKLRYEYKENERQKLLERVEQRKKLLLVEKKPANTLSSNGFTNWTPSRSMNGGGLGRSAKSHALLPRGGSSMGTEQDNENVDNKIFNNMIKN